MLTIREKQVAVLSAPQFKRFLDDLARHVGTFFPKRVKALGTEKTEEAIRDGIARAAAYGIKAERDACLYIDLMFSLGRDFDKDPSLPFASEILSDPEVSAACRIDRVHRAALNFLGDREDVGVARDAAPEVSSDEV
jgi:hypothetical protein